ncbi:MAG: S9 family peptidase, partial [Gammaproteobacteria bacterium]|nr:S9 family peptidase [Gammaproteobacteria bacterium]
MRKTDMEAGKGRYDLWLTTIDGKVTRQLTTHEANETDPAWSADGKHVYFLSARDETTQVWRLSLDDGTETQVTDLPSGVGTFRLTPDDTRIVVSADSYVDCDDLDCTSARNKALEESETTGVVYEQLFIRHWDHWLDAKRSRLFSVELKDGVAIDEKPVLVSGEIDADVPSRVWGGNEEYAISEDGLTVFFTARIRDGNEPTSTNFDIYSAPVNGDGPTVNLTEANAAWDTQPVLSPDGSSLAYLAMQRPGFEADRFAIMIRDLDTGKTRELAPDWDRSASSITFSDDGRFIYANAQDLGNMTLWRFDVVTGESTRLVDKGYVSALDDGASGT